MLVRLFLCCFKGVHLETATHADAGWKRAKSPNVSGGCHAGVSVNCSPA